MNALTKFYIEVLNSVHCAVISDGIIYQLKPDTVLTSNWQPATDDVPLKIEIDGIRKIAVVPIHKILKTGDWDKIIAFHPACESIFAGQSEVLNALTKLAASRLHFTIQQIAVHIIQLALDKGQHGKLNLHQLDLLNSLPAVTDAAKKYFISVAGRNTGISGKYPLLTLRLDRAGIIDELVYNRICTLTSPLLDGPDPMCGISENSHSHKSQQTIRAIYDYIFPKRRTYGSNSNDTPYLLALLDCYYNVSYHLNHLISILGKYANNVQPIPISWHNELHEITKLAKRFLPQTLPGNAGVSLINDAETEAPTTIFKPAPKLDIFIEKEDKPAAPVVMPITQVDPNKPPLGIIKPGIVKTIQQSPITLPVQQPMQHNVLNRMLSSSTTNQPIELTLEARLNQSLCQAGATGLPISALQSPILSPLQQWQQNITQGPLTRGHLNSPR